MSGSCRPVRSGMLFMDHELHRRGSFLLPVRRLWSVGNEGSFQSPSTRTGYLTMLDTSRYILSDCSVGLRTSDLLGDSRSRTRSAGVHHHRSRSNLAALVEHAPKSSLEQGGEVAEAHLDAFGPTGPSRWCRRLGRSAGVYFAYRIGVRPTLTTGSPPNGRPSRHMV